ncbi:MAG: hypothetical protein NXI29_00305 [bacterium]|nr:hypothetical protein [Gimesia chilikensis]MCR9229439.1 hypothetical protein [bacterium]
MMQARQKLVLFSTGLLFFTVITFTSIQNQMVRQPHERAVPHHYEFYSMDVVQMFPISAEDQLNDQRKVLEQYQQERKSVQSSDNATSTN